MLFPHPSASRSASGFTLLTRCLPRISNGLANITATLGSFYWLGFETSGLSPDKKRLAWLGAQRQARLRRFGFGFYAERLSPSNGASCSALQFFRRAGGSSLTPRFIVVGFIVVGFIIPD
jgi:hypothetical protein